MIVRLELLGEFALSLLLLLALRLDSSRVQLAEATTATPVTGTAVGVTSVAREHIVPSQYLSYSDALSFASDQLRATAAPAAPAAPSAATTVTHDNSSSRTSLYTNVADVSSSTQQTASASHDSNEIRSPTNGSVHAVPVRFACKLTAANYDAFMRAHGEQVLCVEIDARWRRCEPVTQSPPMFNALPVGNHTAVAFLAASVNASTRSLVSPPVHFTVLLDRDFKIHVVQLQQRMRAQFGLPDDDDLLTWVKDAATMPSHSFVQSQQPVDERRTQQPPMLLIGVKTSGLYGFAARQAIRSTWGAKKHLETLGVALVFLGCSPPPLDELASLQQQQRDALAAAIDYERRVFRDLLTHELACVDGYAHLPQKVKAFLHYAATTTTAAHAEAPYVMIADDDIYLHVDELIRALQQHGPRERFYAGQVWASQFFTPVVPIRDPRHKNYVSEAAYPLPTFPPFAFGPHVLLSRDCAAFVSVNRDALGDLSSNDDVSLALWLLTMQVHPEHLPSFQNLLDISTHFCSDAQHDPPSLVSLADLAPTAIQLMHANVVAGASFCRGFNRLAWLKPQNTASDGVAAGRHITLQIDATIVDGELLVTTHVVEAGAPTTAFAFVPARDRLAAHAAAITAFVNTHDEQQDDRHTFTQREIATNVVVVMRDTLERLQATQRINSARLTLWRHNLAVAAADTAAPVDVLDLLSPPPPAATAEPRTITIVYSPAGVFAKVVLENVFAAMYAHNPVRVLAEATYVREQRAAAAAALHTTGPSIDVFVFHVLDGDYCGVEWDVTCQRAAHMFIDRYGDVAAQLMMISGEAYDVETLDDRVLLVSTVSDVARTRHVYLPMASMAFSEDAAQSPMVLLKSGLERYDYHHHYEQQHHTQTRDLTQRKFCAYLYARCDRPQREYMFDLLNAIEPVDALGVCQGSKQPERSERWRARSGANAWSDAAAIYSHYKFVIAFENTQSRPGYVTEKLTNAFLAGSVPVYLGHSASLTSVFNPASFIDCGAFATLRACAQRVLEVHRSPTLYTAMLQAPVIANVTRFMELFSWHPDVPSTFHADSIKWLLQR